MRVQDAVLDTLARPGATPWHAWPLLIDPGRVRRSLARIRASGLVERCPSLWQVELGVLRMWHRTFFRSETIGTCSDAAPRRTRWARWLQWRVLRGPFLLAEEAIAPWDMSGLFSPPGRIIKHLLTAHHDQAQCAYDFALLEVHPGALERLQRELSTVVDGIHPRAEWYRDLCVYEGYHEALVEHLDAWMAGAPLLSDADAADPDVSFHAWLSWCARQPETPAEWWDAVRSGTFRFVDVEEDAVDEGVPVDAFPTRPEVRALRDLGQAGLLERFEAGHPVDPDDLPRGRWRGVSLGLPDVVERLAWTTFVKTIVDEGGRTHGWNERLVQRHGAADPLAMWPEPMTDKAGEPVTFGPYGLGVTPAGRPGAGTALIDYRLGDGPRLDPGRRLVDPVVALTNGDPTLLLGRSYVVLGKRWVPTPTWFVLQHIPATGGHP